ncbi:predicted protein [Lichtheimia corymbifera JMRC:FSU:9682]|uniref:Uncharacterized protein n=1 Tax=Lichtheimia corymbifera JMRC:FSU:9682 TaxID=1263082 RepID=A0A068SDD9_9FUNG|nr:predicted protein [Lichtheimia corymbifera JMRC:FSU:9682]
MANLPAQFKHTLYDCSLPFFSRHPVKDWFFETYRQSNQDLSLKDAFSKYKDELAVMLKLELPREVKSFVKNLIKETKEAGKHPLEEDKDRPRNNAHKRQHSTTGEHAEQSSVKADSYKPSRSERVNKEPNHLTQAQDAAIEEFFNPPAENDKDAEATTNEPYTVSTREFHKISFKAGYNKFKNGSRDGKLHLANERVRPATLGDWIDKLSCTLHDSEEERDKNALKYVFPLF